MKKQPLSLILFIFLLLLHIAAGAQSVGIGTSNPNGSSALDITNTSKGLLIPRMTTTGISAIANPAKGLMVYDSLLNQLMVNMGSPLIPNWQTISANSGWSLSGNSISGFGQFLGTTNEEPLIFIMNNEVVGMPNGFTNGCFYGLHTGNGNTSFRNTGVGPDVLSNNNDGTDNTAIGNHAMTLNATGSANSALGRLSLGSNTTGSNNTSAGYASLFSNTSGGNNSAFGLKSLYNNTTGIYNVGLGFQTLLTNTGDLGSYNTAVGVNGLASTVSSEYNTAVGFNAGSHYNMGYNNTILGANCDINQDGLYNCIAIGQAVVCDASSQARIGNAATNSIGGYADWTNISDGRFKRNIKEDVKGLDFIMKLRPVTYNLDVTGIQQHLQGGMKNPVMNASFKKEMAEKELMKWSGFVAQEVEQAAKETGYEFSGVDKPQNADGFYGLRYAQFVVPLIKAVQEQQQEISDLKKIIDAQSKMLQELLNQKKN